MRALGLFIVLIVLIILSAGNEEKSGHSPTSQTAQVAPPKEPVLLSAEKLTLHSDAVSEDDEEIDRKDQADMLASVKDSAIVPYHPNPDLSKKVALLQKEYDVATYEMLCQSLKLPEGLPQAVYDSLFKREIDNSKFTTVYNHLSRIFPDGRDFAIAMGHLSRVHDRVYGNDRSDYCQRNKARFNPAVSVRWVIGCPNIEVLESILSTRIHRGERDALEVAAKNQCKNFPAGQKASIEETKWHNGYSVSRIRLVPVIDFDYWIVDREAFQFTNNQQGTSKVMPLITTPTGTTTTMTPDLAKPHQPTVAKEVAPMPSVGINMKTMYRAK